MSILYFYHLLPSFFLEFLYPLLWEAIGSKKEEIEEKVISLEFKIKNLAWNFFFQTHIPAEYAKRLQMTQIARSMEL